MSYLTKEFKKLVEKYQKEFCDYPVQFNIEWNHASVEGYSGYVVEISQVEARNIIPNDNHCHKFYRKELSHEEIEVFLKIPKEVYTTLSSYKRGAGTYGLTLPFYADDIKMAEKKLEMMKSLLIE